MSPFWKSKIINRKSSIRNVFLLLFAFVLLAPSSVAYALDYYFSVPREHVDVYWESDGTVSLDYEIVFQNSSNGDPIEYVDMGLPNDNFYEGDASASIDGRPAISIYESDYQGNGYGVGVYLGQNAVQPGRTGTFDFSITGIRNVLYEDNQDANLASGLFEPNYFGSQYVNGSSDITVVYHLPPGVRSNEPRWHTAGHSGFPETPETGTDSQGRLTYTWRNANASVSKQYTFGASFPKSYVPADAVTTPDFFQRYGINLDFLVPFLVCLCFIIFFVGLIWIGIAADRKRRMQYLPPKIAIEGNGVKRGLTAPEAGILLEQPMDKIMTMILFSVIKKNAAKVTKQDPLELELTSPRPADLREYEDIFLNAFKEGDTPARRRALQAMMIDLVKGVANKMRGFSKKETVEFYKKITADAWAQVEGANTPKVQSKLFDENLDWTMLDPDYDNRTRRAFTGPVYVPYWYHNYNPTYSGASTAARGGGGVSMGRTTGGASLPTLPGGQFAASVVGGVQNFAGGVIGSLSDFTGGVTKVTNPPPPPTRSSGGGFSGGGSSCACACAGCACACAGGGR